MRERRVEIFRAALNLEVELIPLETNCTTSNGSDLLKEKKLKIRKKKSDFDP